MILRCKVEGNDWIAVQLEEMVKGKLKIIPIEETSDLINTPQIAAKQVWTDRWTVQDLREEAPYYQILPCPYCGVVEDKNHDPLKHVDTHLNGKPEKTQ